MQELIARAEKVARRLKDRGETIVVAESSTGGLISAARDTLRACDQILHCTRLLG